jgi:aryl-alcohol dehydrogenase-like predicted oxidoreductase
MSSFDKPFGENILKTLVIPNTGLAPTQICLGTGSFGGSLSQADSFAMLDAFYARGGRFLDTAHIYSDWIPGTKSMSEKTLGWWFRSSGLRDKIIIATKGAHPLLSSMHISRMSPADLHTDVTESLDFLQTDRIDLYWLHRDAPALPVAEIIEPLNEHVRAGRLRCLGCSNWHISRIREANAYAAARGLQGFVANQPMWSLAVPDLANWPDQTLVAMDAAGVAFHRETQIAAIPYSSQAHGYYTKLDAGKTLADSTRKLYDNETSRSRLPRAQELAKKYGVGVTEIALAYLMAHPFPVFPIIGCHTIAQLDDSLKVFHVTLTPDDVAYLEG